MSSNCVKQTKTSKNNIHVSINHLILPSTGSCNGDAGWLYFGLGTFFKYYSYELQISKAQEDMADRLYIIPSTL